MKNKRVKENKIKAISKNINEKKPSSVKKLAAQVLREKIILKLKEKEKEIAKQLIKKATV